ncbi:Retinol dehydrogenase 14 [Lachnellula arida]|uniref:Retinol dehydrogenase 14 n=1 Tax=Lachnellula arida TaxID=1316785 RepID=A0A8T9BE06_9HELO|nr:Retinol dehydrogenase 14 [Lachnellula arida]
MAGTVLITGANGSLAIPAVAHLLRNYAGFTLILTVRNPADSDVNTIRLRQTIAQFPNAKASIHQLDLANLSTVREFSGQVALDVTNGKYPPLSAIICNAYYWNLLGNIELTGDGYEKTLQASTLEPLSLSTLGVNHIAHVALVLRLVGSFGPDGGRVVLFSSDAHWPGKNGLEKYPPTIPEDLELLIKPKADATKEKEGLAFQRYANSKLAITSWMYALNQRLENNPALSKITAVALNPGNLIDSRSLRKHPPETGHHAKARPPASGTRVSPPESNHAYAGADVVELALNPKYEGERGFFTLLEKDESSPESRDKSKQQRLWVKSAQWAGITNDNTAVGNAVA